MHEWTVFTEWILFDNKNALFALCFHPRAAAGTSPFALRCHPLYFLLFMMVAVDSLFYNVYIEHVYLFCFGFIAISFFACELNQMKLIHLDTHAYTHPIFSLSLQLSSAFNRLHFQNYICLFSSYLLVHIHIIPIERNCYCCLIKLPKKTNFQLNSGNEPKVLVSGLFNVK